MREWVQTFNPKVPEMLIALIQKKLSEGWDQYQDMAFELSKSLFNKQDLPQEASNSIVPMYYFMLMTETKKFMKFGKECFGVQAEALKDIY